MSELIARTSNTLHGQARVAGTRIPVYMVLSAMASSFLPATGENVRKTYLTLSDEQIVACLDYAADVLEGLTSTHHRDDMATDPEWHTVLQWDGMVKRFGCTMLLHKKIEQEEVCHWLAPLDDIILSYVGEHVRITVEIQEP